MFPPFELFLCESPWTKRPENPSKADQEFPAWTPAKLNEKNAKAKAKQYADRQSNAK